MQGDYLSNNSITTTTMMIHSWSNVNRDTQRPIVIKRVDISYSLICSALEMHNAYEFGSKLSIIIYRVLGYRVIMLTLRRGRINRFINRPRIAWRFFSKLRTFKWHFRCPSGTLSSLGKGVFEDAIGIEAELATIGDIGATEPRIVRFSHAPRYLSRYLSRSNASYAPYVSVTLIPIARVYFHFRYLRLHNRRRGPQRILLKTKQ